MGTERNFTIYLKVLSGAVIGPLPAAILWILLGKAGVVAAIAGIIMMLGELFVCDRITRNSENVNLWAVIAVCAAVMLVNIYICERFVWSWELSSAMTEYGMEASIFECFAHFDELMELLEAKGDFTSSLVQSYLFGIIGGAAVLGKLAKR